jgi:hypothetical protein
MLGGRSSTAKAGRQTDTRKRLSNPTHPVAAELSGGLTDYTTDEAGGVAEVFRLAQAAGVSSAVWLIGRLASPGRTEPR